MRADGRPYVLIVDDEPVMRTITESVLLQHEFAVSTVGSAVEALARIAAGEVPDLVLMDVLMPEMDGFEACCQLRRQAHLQHMPIIMLTALDDQDSIDRAYHSGATDFITKPLNIPLLPHRLRYLLRSAEAFKQLMESQDALINAQHIAHLGSWVMGDNGSIVVASGEYLQIMGVGPLPVSEERLLKRVHPEDCSGLQRCRQELRSGLAYRFDYRVRCDDDTWRHVHEMGTPSLDERQAFTGARGFVQDITERVAQEQRIRDLAWHDGLTGLNNRDRCLELIERDLVGPGQGRVALLFIHIDGLLAISTVLGQQAADAAIKIAAARLRGTLAEFTANASPGSVHASILGRYDEQSLLVALPADGAEDVRDLAEVLHRALIQPMSLAGEALLIRVFFGIAYFPEDATDTPELLRRARLVAHNAARDDSGPVNFYDPKHDDEASRRMSLERGLRAAIAQGGQLQPYFQPKVAAASGALVGAEVLLRWQHPELGMVSPGAFIPLAEETGLIHPISEWLLDEVCRMIATWTARGLETGRISINLSADSFFQRSLVQFFDEVLERTGVPPEKLIVELTESVLMQNAEIASQVIGSLRERGLRVSLDDFGTGFSSLGYLNRFTIDEIKIDRSFVVEMERDHKARALVQAIITLGHALGLHVVAEGVETENQAALLRDLGCDIFQGFLYARPMPAGDFERFLEERAV